MPATQWYNSTGIVGLLALFGVVIGLIANHFKMKVELKAAAEEAHRERITAARKEVYYELIGDFVKTSKLIGELTTIDLKEKPNYADALLPLAASVTRTWLVSDIETARKAREVHAQVNELFMKAMTRLPPMQELKDAIKACTDALRQANGKRVELLTELQRNTTFNSGNIEVQSRLTTLKAEQEKIATTAHAERSLAAGRHAVLVRQYTEFLIPHLSTIMKGVQDFMYCARLELGIEGDSDLLRDQTTDMFGRLQSSVNDFLEATKPKTPTAS